MKLCHVKSLGCPQKDMEEDLLTLQNLSNTIQPQIRFYEWSPCVTYGLLNKPEELVDLTSTTAFYKRPTGGGVIFHVYDVSFGIIIPVTHPSFSLNTLQNYRWINQCVVEAIGKFVGTESLQLAECGDCHDKIVQQFCLAHATQYDVVWNGLKVGGAAQRRLKTGLLHQGSVSLYLPSKEFIESALPLSKKYLADIMLQKSASLMSMPPTPEQKIAFQNHLYEALNISVKRKN